MSVTTGRVRHGVLSFHLCWLAEGSKSWGGLVVSSGDILMSDQ